MANTLKLRINGVERVFSDASIYQGTLKDVCEQGLIGQEISIDTLNARVVADIELPQISALVDTVEVIHDGAVTVRYYLKTVKRIGQKNVYEIEAVSAMGVLAETQHDGGILVNAPAGGVIDEIFGSIPHTVDPDLAEERLYGWIPGNGSAREALKQVLFATGAIVTGNDNGNVVIGYIDQSKVFGKGLNMVYSGSSRDGIVPATTVKLTEHGFFESSASATEPVFETNEYKNKAKIVFDKPYHSFSASNGLIVNKLGANYAVITGTGRLSAKPYIHTKRVINASTGVAGAYKEYAVDNAYLVSSNNSDDVLDRVVNYYKQGVEIKADVVGGAELAGCAIEIPDPNDPTTTVRGYIKKMSRVYSGIVKNSVVITQGWTPPTGNSPFNRIKVFTKSDIVNGRISFPADAVGKKGIITVYAGSSGGNGGGYGQSVGLINGKNSIKSMHALKNDGTLYCTEPLDSVVQGGEGGEGGSGGTLGKAITVRIASIPSSLNASFGTGGSGGKGGSVVRSKTSFDVTVIEPTPGTRGTHSVVGEWDSDMGSEMSGASVVNMLTGGIIAEGLGANGINGGRGGNGGLSGTFVSDNNSGYNYNIAGRGFDGESVGENSGGAGAIGIVGTHELYSGRYYHYPLAGGGGGGGAANGAAGSAGRVMYAYYQVARPGDSDSKIIYSGYKYLDPDGFANRNEIRGANGGDGANATGAPLKHNINPGAGGHGGGGGGGCGSPHGFPVSTYPKHGFAIGGKGGDGTDGADGGDGFAVLYWRV